jgi:hypothetical protein
LGEGAFADRQLPTEIRIMIKRLPRAEVKNRIVKIQEMLSSSHIRAAEQAIDDLAGVVRMYHRQGLLDGAEKNTYLDTLSDMKKGTS